MKEGASCPPYNKHLYSEHFLTVMSAFLCIKLTDPSAHTGSHQHLFSIYYCQQNLDIYSWSDVRFDLISPHFFSLPDGLGVNVDGGDALQQEFNHLEEWVGGLFGERQLPSDLPLHTVQTVLC